MPLEAHVQARYREWTEELSRHGYGEDSEVMLLPPLPAERVTYREPERVLVAVIARPQSRAQKYLSLALVVLTLTFAALILYCAICVGVPRQ